MRAISAIDDDTLIAALQASGGSIAAAARAVGLSRRAVQHRMPGLARKGYSPKHDMTHPAPDGFHAKGVSTYYDREGKPTGQWVKTSIDHERQAELLREAVEAMVEDLPKLKPRKAVGSYLPNLLAGYPIGDGHVGMLSWGEETGEDWDLQIAERVHCGAMAALVEAAPAAEYALVANLGDWLHYDSLAAVTPRSGHNLDADGRYAKMVRVAIKIIRQCIESALAKHRVVYVVNAPGNHDETGALWLSAALAHIYEKEPRVIVETTPSLFAYHRHGRTLISIHHGHSCKPKDFAWVVATDRAKDWGETEFRYLWGGHVHHEAVLELPGCRFESFGTMAAKDAHAANNGYRSARNMKCIVFHDRFGEVARHMVNPAMLEAA
jgi:hypothetical protein